MRSKDDEAHACMLQCTAEPDLQPSGTGLWGFALLTLRPLLVLAVVVAAAAAVAAAPVALPATCTLMMAACSFNKPCNITGSIELSG